MRRVIRTLFLVAIVGWSLAPFLWQWITSLKPPGQVSQLPPVWPVTFSLDHYRSVLGNPDFLRVIANSLVVSLGATGLSLGVGSIGAFGIVHLVRGRAPWILLGLLVIFMIPPVAVVTPFFKVMTRLHLKDTWLGLILVYSVFIIPLVVWIMHQVYEEIPRSLYHAARVDGCGNWTIFWRVYLPLSRGGLVSAGLLGILFCWNEFLFALTFTTTYASRTIPVGISLFTGQFVFP
nr:carbohydrate ABC transporter permease [Nitrospinaceae bacterium]